MTAAKQVNSSLQSSTTVLSSHFLESETLKEWNDIGSSQQSQSTYRQPAQSTTNPTTGIASTGMSSAPSDPAPKSSKVYFDLSVAGGKANSNPCRLNQVILVLTPWPTQAHPLELSSTSTARRYQRLPKISAPFARARRGLAIKVAASIGSFQGSCFKVGTLRGAMYVRCSDLCWAN